MDPPVIVKSLRKNVLPGRSRALVIRRPRVAVAAKGFGLERRGLRRVAFTICLYFISQSNDGRRDRHCPDRARKRFIGKTDRGISVHSVVESAADYSEVLTFF